MAGTVRDADGQPLPGASVYLSGTTRGDAADAEGRYRIPAVTPGTYRLVGSMVGFTADVREVQLPAGQEVQLDLKLTPSVSGVGSVVVEAPDDSRWRRRLARFTTAILGQTANAHRTRILNPEVLDFSESLLGTLTATAAAPLIIENRALGYRLHYDLHEFTAVRSGINRYGDEVYENLVPASDQEAALWAVARERAWRGSYRHLLRTLIDGTTEKEGFTLSVTRESSRYPGVAETSPTTGRRIVRLRDGVRTIVVRGILDVTYSGEAEEPAYVASDWYRGDGRRADHQRSYIRFGPPPPVLGDNLETSGRRIRRVGYMAFERLADILPSDYVPAAERD